MLNIKQTFKQLFSRDEKGRPVSGSFIYILAGSFFLLALAKLIGLFI